MSYIEIAVTSNVSDWLRKFADGVYAEFTPPMDNDGEPINLNDNAYATLDNGDIVYGFVCEVTMRRGKHALVNICDGNGDEHQVDDCMVSHARPDGLGDRGARIRVDGNRGQEG